MRLDTRGEVSRQGAECPAAVGIPVSGRRGQEGVLPPNRLAPQVIRPLTGNMKFKFLLGWAISCLSCGTRRPGQAWLPLTDVPLTDVPPTLAQPPPPTALCHSVPGFTAEPVLPQVSGAGKPQNPRLPRGHISVRGQLTVTILPFGLALCFLVPALPLPH